MTIQDFAAFAEIIASIGVIFSLVYVARQINQTNTLNRSSVQQQINGQMANWSNTIASSPELTAVLTKVQFHGLVRDEATEEERIQLGYMLSSILNAFHLMHQQMIEGILTESDLDDWHHTSALLNRPYFNSVWPVLAAGYPADFQSWIEARYHLDPAQADWKDPYINDGKDG